MDSALRDRRATNPWSSGAPCDAALEALLPLVDIGRGNALGDDDMSREEEDYLSGDSLVAKLRAADDILRNRRLKKHSDAVAQIRSQRPSIFNSSHDELLKLEADVKAWADAKIKGDGDVDMNTPLPISQVYDLNLPEVGETPASALQLLIQAHAAAANMAQLGLDMESN